MKMLAHLGRRRGAGTGDVSGLFPSLPERATAAASCLLLVLAPCACERTAQNEANAAGGTRSPPQPTLDLSRNDAWPAPFSTDPVWLRARGGDDLDLARLAHRESAQSLVEALELGGSLGLAALRALPYVPDRAAARGRLCELLLASAPATTSQLLATLYEISMSDPASTEFIHPAADGRCARALSELLARPGLSDTDLDRARVLAKRLADGP